MQSRSNKHLTLHNESVQRFWTIYNATTLPRGDGGWVFGGTKTSGSTGWMAAAWVVDGMHICFWTTTVSQTATPGIHQNGHHDLGSDCDLSLSHYDQWQRTWGVNCCICNKLAMMLMHLRKKSFFKVLWPQPSGQRLQVGHLERTVNQTWRFHQKIQCFRCNRIGHIRVPEKHQSPPQVNNGCSTACHQGICRRIKMQGLSGL